MPAPAIVSKCRARSASRQGRQHPNALRASTPIPVHRRTSPRHGCLTRRPDGGHAAWTFPRSAAHEIANAIRSLVDGRGGYPSLCSAASTLAPTVSAFIIDAMAVRNRIGRCRSRAGIR